MSMLSDPGIELRSLGLAVSTSACRVYSPALQVTLNIDP